jgi:magnesium-dependent phosphatase-1
MWTAWTSVPQLIVFDLDFTLWHPEMYELAGAPFRKDDRGVVTACDGEEVHLFPDVHAILCEIAHSSVFQGTEVAVASSTSYPEWARECLRLIEVKHDSTASVTTTTSRIISESLFSSTKCSIKETMRSRNEHTYQPHMLIKFLC